MPPKLDQLFDFSKWNYEFLTFQPNGSPRGGLRQSIQRPRRPKRNELGQEKRQLVVARTFYVAKDLRPAFTLGEVALYYSAFQLDPEHRCQNADCVHPVIADICGYSNVIQGPLNNEVTLMVEYCEGGDILGLSTRSMEKVQCLPEPLLWHLFKEIIERILNCHRRNVWIVHTRFGLQLAALHDPFPPTWQPFVKLMDLRSAKICKPLEPRFAAEDFKIAGQTMNRLLRPRVGLHPNEPPDQDLLRWIRLCDPGREIMYHRNPEYNLVLREGEVLQPPTMRIWETTFMELCRRKIAIFEAQHYNLPPWVELYFAELRQEYLKHRDHGWIKGKRLPLETEGAVFPDMAEQTDNKITLPPNWLVIPTPEPVSHNTSAVPPSSASPDVVTQEQSENPFADKTEQQSGKNKGDTTLETPGAGVSWELSDKHAPPSIGNKSNKPSSPRRIVSIVDDQGFIDLDSSEFGSPPSKPPVKPPKANFYVDDEGFIDLDSPEFDSPPPKPPVKPSKANLYVDDEGFIDLDSPAFDSPPPKPPVEPSKTNFYVDDEGFIDLDSPEWDYPPPSLPITPSKGIHPLTTHTILPNSVTTPSNQIGPPAVDGGMSTPRGTAGATSGDRKRKLTPPRDTGIGDGTEKQQQTGRRGRNAKLGKWAFKHDAFDEAVARAEKARKQVANDAKRRRLTEELYPTPPRPPRVRGPPQESRPVALQDILAPDIPNEERLGLYEDIFGVNENERLGEFWSHFDHEEKMRAYSFYHAHVKNMVARSEAKVNEAKEENKPLLQLQKELLYWLKLKTDLSERLALLHAARSEELTGLIFPQSLEGPQSPGPITS